MRKIGWEDESVTSRGGPDRDRQYRGKKGEKHTGRLIGEVIEYRTHQVDDVLEPDDEGEPRSFGINCARTWDEKKEEWDGECEGCDREYPVANRYVSGFLLLGVQQGKSPTASPIAPENAVRYWDFGADKYRTVSDIALELKRADPPKKISQVDLVITVDNSKGAEGFQKLKIQVSQAKSLLTKPHLEAWKEEGPKLVASCAAAPKPEEMKRRLKKKKSAKKDEEEPEDEEEEKKPSGKSRQKAGSKKDEEEPEDEEVEVEEEEEKPSKKASGKKAAKKDDDEGGESTGDPEMDELLGELG